MPVVNINFAGVSDTFEPLPSGDYPVVIDHVEMAEGEKGPYFAWDLVVTEPGDFEGRHLRFMTSLSEKSLWRLKAVFANLGVLEDEMNLEIDDESQYLLYPSLDGSPAIATVIEEIYNNRKQNKVEDLLGPDGPTEPVPARAPAATKPAPVTASTKTPLPTRQPLQRAKGAGLK